MPSGRYGPEPGSAAGAAAPRRRDRPDNRVGRRVQIPDVGRFGSTVRFRKPVEATRGTAVPSDVGVTVPLAESGIQPSGQVVILPIPFGARVATSTRPRSPALTRCTACSPTMPRLGPSASTDRRTCGAQRGSSCSHGNGGCSPSGVCPARGSSWRSYCSATLLVSTGLRHPSTGRRPASLNDGARVPALHLSPRERSTVQAQSYRAWTGGSGKSPPNPSPESVGLQGRGLLRGSM